MYARTIEDPATGAPRTLTFGVSGKLIMNVLVMFDRETNTFWSQILGEAVEGPLNGTQLTPLAAVQTTWSEWKALHPDTKALATYGMGQYDSYATYYESARAGVLGETREDDRLFKKALVTGALLNGQPVAYPHSVLRQERVVNDEVDGIPVAVVLEPRTATARLFHRTVTTPDGREQTLTFAPADSGEDVNEWERNGLEFVDRETGTTWFLLNGQAIDGPLAGATLTAIPSTSSFWFGWKDWHPDTLLYGVE